MEHTKINLNQIETLRRVLTDKFNKPHIINFDMSNLEEVMASLTEKQYKYILHLIMGRNWLKAKVILNQQGLLNKKQNNL